MNLCRACGKDFSSVHNFDRHRVGKHAYTYTEGLKFDPPADDGRRCLYTEELISLGLRPDKSGRWSDPTQAAAVRLWATVNATEGSA